MDLSKFKIPLPPELEDEREALNCWTFEKELQCQELMSRDFHRSDPNAEFVDPRKRNLNYPTFLGHTLRFYADVKRLILGRWALGDLNRDIDNGEVGPLMFEYLGIGDAVDAWIVAEDEWRNEAEAFENTIWKLGPRLETDR